MPIRQGPGDAAEGDRERVVLDRVIVFEKFKPPFRQIRQKNRPLPDSVACPGIIPLRQAGNQRGLTAKTFTLAA